jgi:hypothetical protein
MNRYNIAPRKRRFKMGPRCCSRHLRETGGESFRAAAVFSPCTFETREGAALFVSQKGASLDPTPTSPCHEETNRDQSNGEVTPQSRSDYCSGGLATVGALPSVLFLMTPP